MTARRPASVRQGGPPGRSFVPRISGRSACFAGSFGVAGARTTRGPYSLVRSCGTSLAPVLAAASGRVGRTGPDGGWAGAAAIRASNGTATNTPTRTRSKAGAAPARSPAGHVKRGGHGGVRRRGVSSCCHGILICRCRDAAATSAAWQIVNPMLSVPSSSRLETNPSHPVPNWRDLLPH
jgi:hypothetical protein